MNVPDQHMRIQPWNLVFLIGFFVYVCIRGVFARRTKSNEKGLLNIRLAWVKSELLSMLAWRKVVAKRQIGPTG